jgi:hypothetical protein
MLDRAAFWLDPDAFGPTRHWWPQSAEEADRLYENVKPKIVRILQHANKICTLGWSLRQAFREY